MADDPYGILAGRTGLTQEEIRGIAAEVQENHRRLRSCGGHQFVPLEGSPRLGPNPRRLVCTKCRGTETMSRVAAYLLGVSHASGTDYETLLNGAVLAHPQPREII